METGILQSNNIAELLKPRKNDIEKMIDPVRFIKELGFAVQACNSNKILMSASRASIAQAVYNVALTGLSLNPISKLAYLVPKYIKGEWQAVLYPSYQGLVKLITDTGSCKNVYSHCVFEGDDFTCSLGTRYEIHHIPLFKTKKITHVYAVAILNDGSNQVEVMSASDVEEIRDKSDAWKAFKEGKTPTCIWKDYEGEMFRKTICKRITKYLPKTEQFDKVNEAIELDNEDFPASDRQFVFIENLAMNANITEGQQADVNHFLKHGGTASEAKNLIDILQNNQLDAVRENGRYTSTQINEHLEKTLG